METLMKTQALETGFKPEAFWKTYYFENAFF